METTCDHHADGQRQVGVCSESNQVRLGVAGVSGGLKSNNLLSLQRNNWQLSHSTPSRNSTIFYILVQVQHFIQACIIANNNVRFIQNGSDSKLMAYFSPYPLIEAVECSPLMIWALLQ